MSSAIKALVQHHAALEQIEDIHRQADARRRIDVDATTKRAPEGRAALLRAGARRLRFAPKGETA